MIKFGYLEQGRKAMREVEQRMLRNQAFFYSYEMPIAYANDFTSTFITEKKACTGRCSVRIIRVSIGGRQGETVCCSRLWWELTVLRVRTGP